LIPPALRSEDHLDLSHCLHLTLLIFLILLIPLAHQPLPRLAHHQLHHLRLLPLPRFHLLIVLHRRILPKILVQIRRHHLQSYRTFYHQAFPLL